MVVVNEDKTVPPRSADRETQMSDVTAPPGVDAAELTAAISKSGGSWFFSAADDVDAAFDEAVNAAYEKVGEAAHFVVADPDAVEATDGRLSAEFAVQGALIWLRTQQSAGASIAFEVLPRGASTRVTKRAKVVGTEFSLPEGFQPWDLLPPDLELAVADLGAGPSEGEVLGRVSVSRSAGYKAVAHPVRTKSAAEYVVLDGDKIVSRGHATSGEAARAAKELVKSSPKSEHSLDEYTVHKLGGREGGEPLSRIRRERTRQTLTLKLVYCSAKEMSKPPKSAGWLIVTK